MYCTFLSSPPYWKEADGFINPISFSYIWIKIRRSLCFKFKFKWIVPNGDPFLKDHPEYNFNTRVRKNHVN